jgi:hypothetical protein
LVAAAKRPKLGARKNRKSTAVLLPNHTTSNDEDESWDTERMPQIEKMNVEGRAS